MSRAISVLVTLTCVFALEISPVSAAMVYWTDQSARTISRVNDDGTGSSELVLSELGNLHGIAVHPTLGVFWVDQQDDAVYRADFDGTGKIALVTVTDTMNPLALALDSTNGRMYWTDSTGDGTSRIRSTKLDGTDLQTFTTAGSLSVFSGLAVDPVGGKLYWVDTNVVGIWRANLDGSGSEKIVNHIPGTGGPNDIDVDPIGGKIYWSASGLTNTVEWADLNGSNRQTLISGGLSNPSGVAVDSLQGKVYWESNAGIERANLDGTGRETVLGSANATAIALGPASAQLAVPEPASVAMWFGLSVIGLIVAGRRRRRAARRDCTE